MSDSRQPRIDPRPRRSGLGVLLPLLLAVAILFWLMNSADPHTEFSHRGQTLQLLAFETRQGPAIARSLSDFPDDRTEVYLFHGPPLTQASVPPQPPMLPSSPAPAVSDSTKSTLDWPKQPQIAAFGLPLSCTAVNDRDLIIFFLTDYNTGTPSQVHSSGFIYRGAHTTHGAYSYSDAKRIMVDNDALPEIFVSVPEPLRDVKSDTESEPPAPSPAAPVSPPPATPPVEPVAPPTFPPGLDPEAQDIPRLTAVPPTTPSLTGAPIATTPPTTAPAVDESLPLTDDPIWAFGRIASDAPDRSNRLFAMEIAGKAARIRTISSGKIDITGNSFVLTAVPTKDRVHIFWRQVTEKSLPNKVINHAVYDGKEFSSEPALQDVPIGYFTTTLWGDNILIAVMTPTDVRNPPTADTEFHGEYELKYAWLDPNATTTPATTPPAQPVERVWETAQGLPKMADIQNLLPLQRLDGRATQLVVHGKPGGLDKVTLLTLPPPEAMNSPWASTVLVVATPRMVDADMWTVMLLVSGLGVFAGILLVVWIKPWRWFEHHPDDE